jgi:cytochrome P450 family 135
MDDPMDEPSLPPGPPAPRPLQAVLWGLRYPEFTRAGHDRFGATFTLRPGTMPPIVLTSDRDAIRRLLTTEPLASRHGNDAVRPLIGDRSVMLLEPGEHLARRRMLLPPFHGDRIGAYAELMQRVMDTEVDRWVAGETVAVLPIAQNVTIEVILRAVLGVADADTRRRFRRLIDNLLFYPLGAARLRLGARLGPRVSVRPSVRELGAFAAALPTPAVLTYFPELKKRSRVNVLTSRWWKHRDRLLALLDEQIAATRSDPGLDTREDILAMLVRARDPDGNSLSSEDLRDDLVALIGAGHETTAAAIAWGAGLLAHTPEVRDRADAAAQTGDDRYLGALVKEVLRLRPPLPVAAGRVLDEPFPIGAHTIPAGTLIMIDAWGLHHDPQLYPEPERFRPERFLDEPSEPYTWLPFGGGAHRCIGAALAELEIKIGLATILRRVAIVPADPGLAPPARRAVTLVPHGGGRIRIAELRRTEAAQAPVAA